MTDNFPDNVNTVLGSKRLSELGKTLTHEHLALDFRKFYVSPPEHLKRFPEGCPSLQNIGYVRQYPYSSLYNLEFYDIDAAEAVHKDVELFREDGGGTIVENSSHGLKRDIPLMKKVSRNAKVNVIAGTGMFKYLHRKNDFAEVFKNLAGYRSEYSFVEPLKYL